ncbi:Holliday junction resolvase RuvX [soil metagenome]
MNKEGSILALDAGEKRIGVAVASRIARLPRPLATLANNTELTDRITQIIKDEAVDLIVVGLPLGLHDGLDTAQTKWVRDFTKNLQQEITTPMVFHDESLSSYSAKQELVDRGNPHTKVNIDALAATYILDDYIKTTFLKR